MKRYAMIVCPCGSSFEYEDPNTEPGEIFPECPECNRALAVDSSAWNADDDGSESGNVFAVYAKEE